MVPSTLRIPSDIEADPGRRPSVPKEDSFPLFLTFRGRRADVDRVIRRHRAPARGRRRATRLGRWLDRVQDERGVNIVESAFITPVFIFMVLAIGEIGLAMNDYLAEANAVGERMSIPGSLLGVVFMALLIAPSLLRMFGNT